MKYKWVKGPFLKTNKPKSCTDENGWITVQTKQKKKIIGIFTKNVDNLWSYKVSNEFTRLALTQI